MSGDAAAVNREHADAVSPDRAARRLRRARILLWVTPLMWSSNYIVARLAPEVVAPHALALARWTLALALMLPFVGPALWRQRAAWPREIPQLLVLGGLGMWICGAFVYLGGRTTPSINIGLLYAATPVLIAVASARLLHEALSRTQRLGLGLALGGVLFVICKGRLDNLLAVRFTPGDGWIAVAALAWVAYSVLLRYWRSCLGTAERLAAIVAGGIVVMIPFTLLEAWLWPGPPWSWKATGLVLLAAVLPGVLSYQAYSYMQRELGASRTALLLYLSPLYAAGTAWLILGEVPAWYHGVGALLILPSIALASAGQSRLEPD